ncbi:Cys-rich peptide radical SAM maturase CcpM [Paenibacillus albidus]|uniref:Cys-rich peptide radical SAM maturase CcpM n=1 Tax=Paenibacillus albidus TaxID=2041023 RepID=A0A917C0B3_9BACL|nr:radical SAM protein [Paenibacillus albidus]GGF65810.1 Cys-rich peptide radical SAM maturase CcpM [Paenibacillus albidus]
MSDRGFFFTTSNGNSYYYDDGTSNVKYQEKSEKNNFVFGNSTVQEVSINRKELEDYLQDNSGSQLILLTTEACNIRCTYCVYSGNYENQRSHRREFMSVETAKKAVDKYLTNFKQRKFKNPFDNPLIAFYGGEPFLNYELINEVVNFAKNKYDKKIQFSTTTNAILLNDEKIHFLAKNSFILSISLNGDRDEHDRMRVFKDGSGTYEIVMRNLNRIRELYPDYYKEYCQLLITIDTGSNLMKIRDFLKENQKILPKIARISQVGASFTNWYDQYSVEEKEEFINSFDRLKSVYIDQVRSPDGIESEAFLKILFSVPMFSILNRSRNISFQNRRPNFLPYTGACVPGEKIAVDTNGNLHVCERVNLSRSIGDVDHWLRLPSIMKLIEDYQKNITKDCPDCPVHSLCDICYAGVLDGEGGFDKSYMEPNCQKIRKHIQKQFAEIWSIMEEGILAEDLVPNF